MALTAPPAQARLPHEIAQLMVDVQVAATLEKRRKFSSLIADPIYLAHYEGGYDEGRADGVIDAFKAFKRDVLDTWNFLEETWELLKDAYDVYTSPVGTPLPEDLRRRLEAAAWCRELVEILDELPALMRMTLDQIVDMKAAEVVSAMRAATAEWINKFYALNGKPREQGHHVGRLIGRACGEIVVAALLEIATAGAATALVAARIGLRIRSALKLRYPRKMRRPLDLDDAVRDIRREALAASRAGRAAADVADEVRDAERFVQRLKAKLPPGVANITDALDDAEWLHLAERARAIKKGSAIQAAWTLKGEVSELLYPKTPWFSKLRGELARRLEPEWGEIEFHRTARAARAKGGSELLTDGLFIARPKDPSDLRVRVLAVFEGKSRTNVGDVAQWKKDPGDVPYWGGQLTDDFERFKEVPVTIGGKTYDPKNIVISKDPAVTRWVVFTARDVSLKKRAIDAFKRQGFLIDEFNLRLFDRDITRIAFGIVDTVRGE